MPVRHALLNMGMYGWSLGCGASPCHAEHRHRMPISASRWTVVGPYGAFDRIVTYNASTGMLMPALVTTVISIELPDQLPLAGVDVAVDELAAGFGWPDGTLGRGGVIDDGAFGTSMREPVSGLIGIGFGRGYCAICDLLVMFISRLEELKTTYVVMSNPHSYAIRNRITEITLVVKIPGLFKKQIAP